MQRPRYRVWIGVALVALGLLWGLNAFGLVPEVPFWPALVILIGLVMLLSGRSSALTGVVVIVFGVLLLLNAFGVLDVSAWALLPGLVVAGIGISILSASVRHRVVTGSPAGGTADADGESLRLLFSGTSRIYAEGTRFVHISVLCAFAGAELDLTRATVADGAVIDLDCYLGGLTLKIADSVNLVNQTTAVMGGVGVAPATSGPTLILRGTIVMGGVEVKRMPADLRG